MSLAISRRPSVAFGGETVLWNAVGNPILYIMQRQDFAFNQINNAGGFVQLQFNGVDRTGSFAIGDSVYIYVAGQYDGYATVTGESFAGNTLITTNMVFGGGTGAGFVNNHTLRKNYRVSAFVVDAVTGLPIGSESVYSPTSIGFITINVSPTLKSFLRNDIDQDLTLLSPNWTDSPIYKRFYIATREVWTGSAEAVVYDVGNNYFAVNAARQIPSPNGGWLSEYVHWTDGVPVGFMLTTLTRPKIWRGYPAMFSYIISTLIGSANYFVEYFDINGSVLTPHLYSGSSNGIFVVDIKNVAPAMPADAVMARITLRLETLGPSYSQISWSVVCDIVDPCENSVMLLGRNHLGGIMQWLFEYDQGLSMELLTDTKAKRLQLVTERLTINEWTALQDFISLGNVYKNNITDLTASIIKTSTRVDQQLYVIDTAGNKIGVIGIPTKNSTRTKRYDHSFELTIEYPEAQIV